MKTFIEASGTYNIHTAEKLFAAATSDKVHDSFLSRQIQQTCGIFWRYDSSLHF